MIDKNAEDRLWKFHRELEILSKKYGISISSRSTEEIDYDYEENPYISGYSDCLVLSDKDGNEITVRDIISDDVTS